MLLVLLSHCCLVLIFNFNCMELERAFLAHIYAIVKEQKESKKNKSNV